MHRFRPQTLKPPRLLIAAALVLAGAALSAARAEMPSSAMDVHPLLIRAEVPGVTLQTADGGKFDLAAEVRRQPSIVIFYRGGW